MRCAARAGAAEGPCPVRAPIAAHRAGFIACAPSGNGHSAGGGRCGSCSGALGRHGGARRCTQNNARAHSRTPREVAQKAARAARRVMRTRGARRLGRAEACGRFPLGRTFIRATSSLPAVRPPEPTEGVTPLARICHITSIFQAGSCSHNSLHVLLQPLAPHGRLQRRKRAKRQNGMQHVSRRWCAASTPSSCSWRSVPRGTAPPAWRSCRPSCRRTASRAGGRRSPGSCACWRRWWGWCPTPFCTAPPAAACPACGAQDAQRRCVSASAKRKQAAAESSSNGTAGGTHSASVKSALVTLASFMSLSVSTVRASTASVKSAPTNTARSISASVRLAPVKSTPGATALMK